MKTTFDGEVRRGAWERWKSRLEQRPDGTWLNPEGIDDESFFQSLEEIRREPYQYPRIDTTPPVWDAELMAGRSSQLQIRITPEQKATLKRLSDRTGQDMSTYVLSRALPDAQRRFAELLEMLPDEDQPGFVLAELNDLLSSLATGELCSAVEHADLAGLSPYLRNYVAAMVELAAHRQDVPPPAWVRDVEPLETTPHFATPLAGLRLHLLRAAPVPFKRRNIFIDSSIGDRV